MQLRYSIIVWALIALVLSEPPPDVGKDGLNRRNEPASWRIVDGRFIKVTDAPYQLRYGETCGAVLIHISWALTAMHCPFDKNVKGGSSHEDQLIEYPIRERHGHLKYFSEKAQKNDYDIQALELQKPIPITKFIKPIPLGTVFDVKPGVMVTITGWGWRHLWNQVMSKKMRAVEVPIMENKECRMLAEDVYHNITVRQFCAGFPEGGKDSCHGDDGGAAVADGKLLGIIVAHAPYLQCASPHQPSIYINVPVMQDWIQDITGLIFPNYEINKNISSFKDIY